MNENPIVLALDFGTQSVRALLIDKNGNILAIEKEPYQEPYFSLEPGYAEQYPDYYWKKACLTTNRIKENYPHLYDDIICMSITCFRDTAVILDENKEVIRPSILWLDQRMAECKKPLPILNRLIFYVVGMSDTVKMNRRRTMANWIKENEPENWAKTKHYIAISTFFNYKLTGKLVDSISNQIGHYPIDFKKRRWYKDNHLKGIIFGVPRKMLCDLVKQGDPVGKISHEASLETGLKEGLLVFAAGSDKGCETIGTGCLTPDKASISYGTASSIEVPNPRYIEPETFLPSYPAVCPNLYNMEVQIYRGYWMITWFKKEFAQSESVEAEIQKMAVEEYLNKKMLQIPPGSQGLVLQPYWGPGLKRPEAKGSIIGFSDFHTKTHVYKAIIEGIAYGLREGLEGIQRRQHRRVKNIMVSGGGSQSDAICQITADIFGIPVSRIQTFETAGLGAAMVGFVSMGVFSSYDEASESMTHISKTFYPDEENHTKYDFLFKKVYLKMYGKLKRIYRNIGDFNHD